MSAHAYRHRLTVRFRDCDAMGHVNHAVYFTYLEQCRLTCWREITGAPSPHTRVIIAHAECDYRAPAHFGDELEIVLGVAEIGRSSFTLAYDITCVRGGQLIATGRTVMVAYDYEAGRSVPLPQATRGLLRQMAQSEGTEVTKTEGTEVTETEVTETEGTERTEVTGNQHGATEKRRKQRS